MVNTIKELISNFNYKQADLIQRQNKYMYTFMHLHLHLRTYGCTQVPTVVQVHTVPYTVHTMPYTVHTKYNTLQICLAWLLLLTVLGRALCGWSHVYPKQKTKSSLAVSMWSSRA